MTQADDEETPGPVEPVHRVTAPPGSRATLDRVSRTSASLRVGDGGYNEPWQVALRLCSVDLCDDIQCDLSLGYLHAGPCEPCSCGMRHAVWECPEHREREDA